MTTSEMEEAIRNLQDQANRFEQFLPTLATREELYATRDDLRRELQTVRDDVMRYALLLNERTEENLKIVAEGVVSVRELMGTMVTKAEMQKEFQRYGDALSARMDVHIATL